MNPWKSL